MDDGHNDETNIDINLESTPQPHKHGRRGKLATHIITHTFQHTLFDWLKFTWVLPNHMGPI